MRNSLLGIALVAGLLVTGVQPRAQDSETYRQLILFGDVFERIRADYVEEVKDPDLIEAAINGMLSSLDPHSSYLNAKNYRDMQVQTRGEFGGLGIEVTMENGLVKVVSPIDDTPAFRAGLKSGDLVTHLDGEPVLGLTLGQAVEKMRGPVNSAIDLTIARSGEDKTFDVSITREIIRIRSVRHRVEGDVGYVRIISFNEQTNRSLKRTFRKAAGGAGRRGQGLHPGSAQQSGRACWTRPSPSPTRSCRRAKSSRPGAGATRTRSASTRARAISPTASR